MHASGCPTGVSQWNALRDLMCLSWKVVYMIEASVAFMLTIPCTENPLCQERLLIKKMEAIWIHPKMNRWLEEFLNNKTFRVKLSDHHSSEGTEKSGVPRALCLDPFSSWYLSMTWQMNWHAIICSSQATSSSSSQEVRNTSYGHQSNKRSIGLVDRIFR